MHRWKQVRGRGVFYGTVALLSASFALTTLFVGSVSAAGETITAVTPNQASMAGGDTVTISGSGFVAGETSVYIGGNEAVVTGVTSTAVTITVPASMGFGEHPLIVRMLDGSTAVAENKFLYTSIPATVSSVSPNAGPAAGGQSVTLSGSGFLAAKNATTNSWSNKAAKIPTAVRWASLGIVNDRVYLYGGVGSPTGIWSAPLNDPTNWRTEANVLPASIVSSQFTQVGNMLYLFGSDSSNVILTASAADPTSWTIADKTLPGNLSRSTLTAIGDNLYLIGGTNNSSTHTGAQRLIYTASKSDPTTWSILSSTALPAARSYGAVVRNDQYIYYIGGANTGTTMTNTIYRASINNLASWTSAGTLPTVLGGTSVAVIGDTAYLLGGRNDNPTISNRCVSTIYSSPLSNLTTWTSTGKTLPTGLAQSQAALINDNIYLFGGSASGDQCNTQTNSIFSAPVSYFQPNQYMNAWQVSWPTQVNGLANPSVSFGANAATDVTVATETTVTATTPVGTPGDVVDVRFMSQDSVGSIGLADAYTYSEPPIATSLTPTSGMMAGGDMVTVTGGNFTEGMTVTVNGSPAGGVTVINESTLTFTTPSNSFADRVKVVISNSLSQTSAPLTYTYKLSPPTITSINPDKGPASGGTAVTVAGTGFYANSTDNTWTNTGNALPVGFSAGALAVIGDTIYMFGGSLGGTTYSSGIYSAPVSNPTAWTNTGKTLPSARALASLVVVGSNIYLFGGTDASNTVTGTIFTASVSDPTTWTNTGKILPAPRTGAGTIVIGDTIYMFGGANAGSYGNTVFTASVSDPTTWTNSSSTLPANIADPQLAVIGDTLYAFGGSIQAGTTNATNRIYSAPVSNPTAWTNTGKTLPSNLSGGKLMVIGDNLYLYGGLTDTSTDPVGRTNAIYIATTSDPTTWTNTGKTLPAALFYGNMAVINDHVYYFGGRTDTFIGSHQTTIFSAPINRIVPNQYNPSWTTNWSTNSTGPYRLTFDGTEAAEVVATDSTHLTAKTPAHAVGATDVQALTFDGSVSNTLVNAYTYLALPTATSLIPSSGSMAGGDTVTVTGSGFVSDDTTVTMNGAVVPEVTVLNSTTLTFTTPASTVTGAAKVVVSNSFGESAEPLTYTYTLPQPIITDVTPDRGPTAGGTSVTVTGSGFVAPNSTTNTFTTTNVTQNGAGTATVIIGDAAYMFGGNTASGSASNAIYLAPVSNPTAWTNTGKTLPAARSHAGLAVIGDKIYMFGGRIDAANSVTNTIFSAPITDPTTWTNTGKTLPAARSGATTAVIGDKIYMFGGRSGSVAAANTIYSASTSDPTAWTNTGKTLPANLNGASFVRIRDTLYLIGGSSNEGTAYVNTIYSASISDPTTWTNTGKTLPAALGFGTVSTIGEYIYLYGGVSGGSATNTIYSASISDPTTWTNTGKTLPTATSSLSTLLVNDQLYLFGTNTTYTAPVVHTYPNQYNPSWMTNWHTDPDANLQYRLAFGGVNATEVTVVNSTSITAKTPAHAEGAVDVQVSTFDGSTSNALVDSYTYVVPPTIAAITPSSGSTSGGDTVTITGTGFTPDTTVTIGGVAVTSIVIVNDTTITATTPAHAAGTVDVTVVGTLGQTATLTSGYTYLPPPPTVTNISPSAAKMQGGASVTITGTGFIPGSIAYFDGVAAATTSLTSTSMTVTIPAHLPADVSVTVDGPYTSPATAPNTFRYTPDRYVFTNPELDVRGMQPGEVTIEAQDNGGSPVTAAYDNELLLTSTSTGGSFSLDGVTWGATSVTIPNGATSITLYYRDANKGTPTIRATDVATTVAQQTETIRSRYTFLVTGVTDPVEAGIPSSITVQAVDWRGDATEDYVGTIHFTSTDPFAVLPTDTAITSGMHGRVTLTNGVTMVTTGEHLITVTDKGDSDISGSQQNITVNNGFNGTPSQLAVITPQRGAPANTPTDAITVQVQDEEGRPVAVPVDTTIYVRSDSSSGQFSTASTSGWSSSEPFAVTIAANTSSTNIYYRDATEGTWQLQFSDQTGTESTDWTDAQQEVYIGSGPPAHIVLNMPTTQPYGSWRKATVRLTDSSSANTVNQDSVPLPLYLTSNNPTVLFSLSSTGSSSSGSITVPIAPGAHSATVYVYSPNLQTADVTASDASPADSSVGLTDDTVQVRFVAPNATSLRMTLATPTVKAGESVAVTLSAYNDLDEPAMFSGATSYALTDQGLMGEFSLAESPWTATGTVSLPANTSSVTFYYRTTFVGTANLRASGTVDALASITVTGGDFARFGFTSGVSNIPVSRATSHTVSAQDVYGNIVPVSEDTPVYLYSSTSSGSFASGGSGPWTLTTVTIPSGSTSATFYYQDDNLGATGTMTASDNTPLDDPDSLIINATKPIAIVGHGVDHLTFLTGSQTVTAGQSSGIITVQASNSDGTPAIQGSDLTLSLYSSSPGSPSFTATPNASAPSIATVTISAGQSSASFYYRDTAAGVYNLVAQTGGNSEHQAIHIVAAASDRIGFVSPEQTGDANTPSGLFQIGLRDQYGNPATSTTNTTIVLSSTCSDGTFSLTSSPWNSTSSVVINAGQSSASFYFKTAFPDCIITVSASGLTAASQPYHTLEGPMRISVMSAPNQLEVGEMGEYIVSLQDMEGNVVDSLSDMIVYAHTSHGNFERNRVTIRAGDSSATFRLSADATGTAYVRFTDQSEATPDTGLIDATATTTIVSGAPHAVQLSPGFANGVVNTSQAYTVHLLNTYGAVTTAPSDTLVSLSSNNPTGVFTTTASTASTPLTQVIIPANSSSASFYYHQTTTGTTTITGSGDSLISDTANLAVIATQIDHFEFSSSPSTASAGQTVSYTVRAYDELGNIVTLPAGYSIFVHSSGGGNVNSSNYNASSHAITLNSSATSVTFSYMKSTPGTTTITASEVYPPDSPDTAPENASASLTVTYGVPGSVTFMNAPGSFERGATSGPVTVELRNQYGIVMPAPSDTTVWLESNVGSGQFAPASSGPWNSTSITIPSGSSSATFYYRDESNVGPFLLTVSSSGLSPDSATGSVVYGQPTSLYFLADDPQVLPTTHASRQYRIGLLNAHNKPTVMPVTTTVSLRSSSPQAEFAPNIPSWGAAGLSWSAGSMQTGFYYRDSLVGTHTITVAVTGLSSALQQVVVVPQAASRFHVTNISTPQPTNNPSSVVVIAQDAEGYTVADYNGTITFSTTDTIGAVPGNYTFVPGEDRGIHTFTNGVLFCTPGTHTVTATDGVLSGQQVDIIVTGELGENGCETGGTATQPPTDNQPPATGATDDPRAQNPGSNNGDEDNPQSGVSPDSGSTENRDDQAGRGGFWTNPAKAFTAAVSQIASLAKAVARSPATPYVVPGIIYGLLLILGLVIMRGMYREIKHAHILIAALKREKKTADHKTTFISLVAHYLRTPATIIDSSVDLLARTTTNQAAVSSLKQSSSELLGIANEIVADTEKALADIKTPETKRQLYGRLYLNPLFWMPIVIAIAMVVITDAFVHWGGGQTLSLQTYAVQVLLGVVVAALLYAAIRNRTLRHKERETLQAELQHRFLLDTAKNDVIASVAEKLSTTVVRLRSEESGIQEVSPAASRVLHEGIARISSLVNNMERAQSVQTARIDAVDFTSTALLDGIIARKAAIAAQKKVAFKTSGDDVSLHQDARLMIGVFATILDNAIAFSHEGSTIQVDTKQTGEALKVTVKDTGSHFPQEVLEHPDTPFNHQENYLNGEHQGIGLSLYVDSLIMRHLGGEIALKNDMDGAKVILRLPVIAKASAAFA